MTNLQNQSIVSDPMIINANLFKLEIELSGAEQAEIDKSMEEMEKAIDNYIKVKYGFFLEKYL